MSVARIIGGRRNQEATVDVKSGSNSRYGPEATVYLGILYSSFTFPLPKYSLMPFSTLPSLSYTLCLPTTCLPSYSIIKHPVQYTL